jgi:hypothetical protein
LPSVETSRPGGVTAIAGIFFAASAYLCALAIVYFAAPGTLPLSLGAPLLFGLELAGPYMFLIVGAAGVLVAWGLLRLNSWVRWIAILAALFGVLMLVPSVSGSVVYFDFARLAWGGLGIVLRVAIVWYLFQEPVKDQFA